MSWLAGHHWGWLLLAALLGSALTAFLTLRKASVQREVVRNESSGPDADLPSVSLAGAGVAGTGAVGTAALVDDAPAYEPPVSTPSADGSLATSAVTYDDPDATMLRSNVAGFDADSPTATEAGWAPEEPAAETIRRSDSGSFDSEATFAADDPPPLASDAPDTSSHDGELATEAGWAPVEPEADPTWGDGTAETGADTVLDDADLEDTDGNASAAVAGDAAAAAAAAGGAREAGAHAAGAHAARPAPVGFASTITESSFGPGSALPLEGGASPSAAFTIKGNADSMKFHTTESPYFGRTIAEVWFDSEDAARGAGFHRWDEKKAEVAAVAMIPDGAFGPGSADPNEDGSAPSDAFTIKGNADSMLFHGPESPYYGRTKAEVWFTDADTARRAGFTGWNEN